ncbi:u1 small nuclear ribonucleoprotein 70 kd, putative [Perkinsus marinus ATCC 50983]|uniref:U1 small nuclear ribonucleoprotein 70 kd, putative n=1 Tax=Perkinsus marinus (strain ATCC 50983 / TXsc) TaxID=423536 RepID=C5K5N9_PERM5|nr:u1 small nuclear ribonucleoprotein 70 kd, putative [Perkinsus marinus ATCC 50983]EER20196.1 u1 small nuclear ribonucleoprotein 70 kd, putative [Perkinsus marinus ATCC 50983]|eukprot:XP_002788400.1 u1 small nuclear ribonucleoprotein 70 kd, putative [Perkinsus marinus ATCC 50983]
MSAQGMPPHLLALFCPRPPQAYEKPQIRKAPVTAHHLTGLADFVEYFEGGEPPEREHGETPLERKKRRAKEKKEKYEELIERLKADYKPQNNDKVSGDPFKTLFVARVAYETTEKQLQRIFGEYGPIRKVTIIHDLEGRSRGYAFIEYDNENSLKQAYKNADGIKVDGRRVLVDVERGRTVSGWIPRRMGGGRGSGRIAKPKSKKNTIPGGPPPSPYGPPEWESGYSSRMSSSWGKGKGIDEGYFGKGKGKGKGGPRWGMDDFGKGRKGYGGPPPYESSWGKGKGKGSRYDDSGPPPHRPVDEFAPRVRDRDRDRARARDDVTAIAIVRGGTLEEIDRAVESVDAIIITTMRNRECSRVSPTCRKLCNIVRDAIESVVLDASSTTVETAGTLGRYVIGVDPLACARVLTGTLAENDYVNLIKDERNPFTDANECSFRRLEDYANLKNLTIRNIRGRECWLRLVETLRRSSWSRVRCLVFERCHLDPSFVHFLASIFPHFAELQFLRFEQCIFLPSTLRRVYLARCLHEGDGRVPKRKHASSEAIDRCYIGKYSEALLHLITAIGRITQVKNLVMTECNLGALQKSLQHLELDENCLFDAGIYPIAQSLASGGFAELETLSLMGNYISTYGFITLLMSLPEAKKLTDVDLSDNQINFVARGQGEEVIDLDIADFMMIYVKAWAESSSKKLHLGLAGNNPCGTVVAAVERAVDILEESKATEGILDFQQRSVRSTSTPSFQEEDEDDDDADSMMADCGSHDSSSEEAASIGSRPAASSSDDDDEDDDANLDLQIGLTALAGGDDGRIPKRSRRGTRVEVTESEVEREQNELHEMMSRNPLWRLRNEEFVSDDDDDQDFEPAVDASEDEALSGLVTDDDM